MKLWINLRSSSRLTPVAIFVWSHDVAEARSSCHACGACCGAETARLGLARLGDHQRSRCWVLEDRNMRQAECSVAEHTTCCHRRALRPWVRGHGFYLARRQVPSDVLQTLSRTLLWLVHDEPLPWTVCWPQPQICGAPCIFKSGSPRIGRPSFPCTWQCWNFSPSSAGCRGVRRLPLFPHWVSEDDDVGQTDALLPRFFGEKWPESLSDLNSMSWEAPLVISWTTELLI